MNTFFHVFPPPHPCLVPIFVDINPYFGVIYVCHHTTLTPFEAIKSRVINVFATNVPEQSNYCNKNQFLSIKPRSVENVENCEEVRRCQLLTVFRVSRSLSALCCVARSSKRQYSSARSIISLNLFPYYPHLY